MFTTEVKLHRAWKGARSGNLGLGARRRGQSLVVAVIVMFVLLFIGGIFVGLVARNLQNSGRQRDNVRADELAQAGLRIAQTNLLYSPEGADWRPTPTAPSTDGAGKVNDPDQAWLDQNDIVNKGFTRIPQQGGRILVKVSMTPDPNNPLGKLIKIESVGRVGNFDPSDPTTMVEDAPAPRLRRATIAYMQIGITDYMRFVTNRFNDSKAEAVLGTPQLDVPAYTHYGLPVRGLGSAIIGGGIRTNCDLRLLNNITIGVNANWSERVLVDGNIKPDAGDPNGTDLLKQPARFLELAGNTGGVIAPSTDPAFDTFNGLLRDASSSPDQSGHSRSVSRLEPPLIDQPDPNTGVGRYLQSTRDAGPLAPNTGLDLGKNGAGTGIYVDNTSDTEDLSVSGSAERQTLTALWKNAGGKSRYWNGPYFTPPGAKITFGPVMVPKDDNGTTTFESRPGFSIELSPESGTKFLDENGKNTRLEADYTFFIYSDPSNTNALPVLKLDNYYVRQYLKNAGGMSDTEIDKWLPPFNGVIYTAGNARVSGILPDPRRTGTAGDAIPINPGSGSTTSGNESKIRANVNPPSITLVSGQNIYVEGSLLRDTVSGAPVTAIALLARNYVTVNTTLFVRPNKSRPFGGSGIDTVEPGHTGIGVAEAATVPPFALLFDMGDDATNYTAGGKPVPVRMLVRHGTPGGQANATYMGLNVNGFTDATVYPFAEAGLPTGVHRLLAGTQLPATANGQPITSPQFYNESIDLWSTNQNPPSQLFAAPGFGKTNMLRPFVSPVQMAGEIPVDYLFGRAAIVPMDVRIEATIYAQDGSFFVMPGYAMNNNPDDTRMLAQSNGRRPDWYDPTVKPITDDLFPFYDEPIDCRVTVVGSVAENQTASLGDQTAWMRHWGYIPGTYGSSANPIPDAHLFGQEVGGDTTDLRSTGEQSANIGPGLRFLYDPALAVPYVDYDLAKTPLRLDTYGRILPPMPRLPVCPGFVYTTNAQ